ncbi:MAG: DNA primase DnaG [archaeon]|nr:DNA primase DnaG [archaeon]
MNGIDPTATKYMIKAKISAEGIVEKPDVVGAIFGQTEGLLGDELDLRDLQKSGRIGRIEVDIISKSGKSDGIVYVSSSLDQVKTVILASALEIIDRVGPCKASIKILGIEDVRITKKEQVIERAKELLSDLIRQSKGKSADLTESVRQSIQIEEITTYGKDRCPAGPNVKDSESIIIVEGRSDVLNLLKIGIKNCIAVEGTSIPETVIELSKEKIATAFVDGDRGGELILKELFQVAEIDFVARAPRAHEVEELSVKQITKCLRNKVPSDQYIEMNDLSLCENSGEIEEEQFTNQKDHELDNSPKEYREDDRKRDRDRRERFNTEAAERFRKKSDPVEASEFTNVNDNLEDSKSRKFFTNSPITEEIQEKTDKSFHRKKESSREEKVLSPDQQIYRDMLLEMASTHNARILNMKGDVIREEAVKNLVDSLKNNSDSVATIVFDGVISQRIVDVASSNGISTVVGTRKGNISKMPAGLALWTKEDLCR